MKPSSKILCLSAVALALGYGSLRLTPTPVRSGNPLSTLVRGPPATAALRGRVEQRLSAGSYTYLALRTEDGALRWAVTLGGGAPAGARVAVRSMGQSQQFYSARLRRTFSDLVFGIVSPL